LIPEPVNTWNVSAKPEALPCLEKRALLIGAIRDFFFSRDFQEVETPVRVKAPAPEIHIEAVACRDMWFRTSPELEMKCLLANGREKIFQIGPCFRAGEHGRLHREEFTMLEWYETGVNYQELIPFTRDLLLAAKNSICGKKCCRYQEVEVDFVRSPEVFTLREVFTEFAGISPEEALEKGCYEEMLVEKIEPALPRDRAVILQDYPAELAALARLKADDLSLAERWELYLGGLEIANTYSELTDPDQLKKRFAGFNQIRQDQDRPVYPENKAFFKAVGTGIPPCSGSALGLDRLLMVLTDADDIAQVL